MKKFFLILMIGLLSMKCYGQIETVAAKTGYLLYYPSMEQGKIRKGDRLYVLYQMDNGNYMVEYKERRAMVDISFFKVNDDVYRMIRAKELLEMKDREIQAYEDSVKEAYQQRLMNEGVEKIKTNDLHFSGVIKDNVEMSGVKDLSNHTDVIFLKGDTVEVFYYSVDKNKKVAGIYNDNYYGYINGSFLELEERDAKVLQLVPDEMKIVYADKVVEFRKAYTAEKYRQKVEDLMKTGELSKMYKDGFPIFIIRSEAKSINVVGHVEVGMEYINLSNKEINALFITGSINDETGKPMPNEISPHNKTVTFRISATVQPQQKGYHTWDRLSFYSKSARSFTVTSFRIQYKDGSTVSLNAAKCQTLMAKCNALTPEERLFYEEHWP